MLRLVGLRIRLVRLGVRCKMYGAISGKTKTSGKRALTTNTKRSEIKLISNDHKNPPFPYRPSL